MRTIRRADQVIVLREGRITESGSPEELLAQGGDFAAMVALQMKEREEIAEKIK